MLNHAKIFCSNTSHIISIIEQYINIYYSNHKYEQFVLPKIFIEMNIISHE